MSPFSQVILFVGHYCNYEDRLAPINYSTDQSIFVSFDIEHCVTRHDVRCRVDLLELGEIVPARLFYGGVPRFKRRYGVAMD